MIDDRPTSTRGRADGLVGRIGRAAGVGRVDAAGVDERLVAHDRVSSGDPPGCITPPTPRSPGWSPPPLGLDRRVARWRRRRYALTSK
jgi:hypothetical protein